MAASADAVVGIGAKIDRMWGYLALLRRMCRSGKTDLLCASAPTRRGSCGRAGQDSSKSLRYFEDSCDPSHDSVIHYFAPQPACYIACRVFGLLHTARIGTGSLL